MDKPLVKILCPLAEYGRRNDAGEWQSDYFVTRPARWLGRHSIRRDEVVEKAGGNLGSSDVLKFAISMALLDDWHLPGLHGNPENWDFSAVDLEVILWVNREIFDSFQECYAVKKKLVLDIAEWIESRGRNKADDPGNWRFDGDIVKTTPASAIIRIWEAYKKSGVLPEPGGWLDQPLDILVSIGVIDTVYETYEYKNSEGVKYEKFTPTQRAIIREVEKAATVG